MYVYIVDYDQDAMMTIHKHTSNNVIFNAFYIGNVMRKRTAKQQYHVLCLYILVGISMHIAPNFFY